MEVRAGIVGRCVATLAGAALLLALLVPGLPATASTATPAAARTVRVGFYENPPKVFTGEDGKPAGIFPELLQAIAQREGWHLVWVPGTWEEGLASLDAGRIDLMPDVALTEERSVRYGFHVTPVIESWSSVYARPGTPIERLSQLSGYRVAVLRGSVQEETLRTMVEGFGLSTTLVPVGTLKEGFEAVRKGTADAAVANHLFGDYFSRDYGLAKTPVVFGEVPLYFAALKGHNNDLLVQADRWLSEWEADHASVYYRVLDRYTGSGNRDVASYLLWAAAAVLTLLGLVLGMAYVLRWQVRRRTRELTAAADELRKQDEGLRKLATDVVEAMGRMVEARDPYTHGHQTGVARIAVLLGEELGLPPEELAVLERAGLVHDIGKLAVPSEILTKPGKLAAAELALIAEHPVHGYGILKDIEFGSPIADIVLQHHERTDGSGYPEGLAGEEILLAARIVAVADVVEAMSSHRPYRPSCGACELREELTGVPDRYDGRVVAACLRLLARGDIPPAAAV